MLCPKILAGSLAPSLLAHAHPGIAHGFFHGVSHPFHGMDHLLAMVAVGLWAAQIGGRARWALPTSFLGLMTLGGTLGMLGVPVPGVETGILTSVVLLGLLLLFAVRPPLWMGSVAVGTFAVFHGIAHGAEIPAAASGFAYASGFLAATAMLIFSGLGAGLALRHRAATPALRVAGALVMIGGVFLASPLAGH